MGFLRIGMGEVEILVERLDDVVIGIFDLRWEVSDGLHDLVECFFERRESLGDRRESLFER